MTYKRALLFVFALIFCVVLSGCDLLFGIDVDHVCTYTEWEETEEATCMQTGEEERYCIICYDIETRPIARDEHSPIEYRGKAATCLEAGRTSGIYCEECNGIISGMIEIPALEHTVVVDPAIPVTDDKPGRTEGKHCSTCGEVLVKQLSVFSGEYSTPESYHGDYAYKSLLTLNNGEKMAEFYEEIDAAALEFHSSLSDAELKKNGENDIYYMAEIKYSDNGITSDQALSTWSAYIKDHPLYYWLSSHTTYTDDHLTVIVNDEHIDGEVREAINKEIYKTVEEYILYLEGETSVYGITLGLHDVIIDEADYAYLADGVTPSDTINAHNILGVLIEGEGVCESYAKAFQLILNYCGINNVYVTGYAGEAHGWNLVQLDDGRWYWYDLTWDDQPRWMLGVRHNYFCVSSSDYVNWSDGGKVGTKRFHDDHTPTPANFEGVNYNYGLPTVSETPYNYDGLMLRDEVIVDNGLSYVLIGFNKVALINIDKEGAVSIPESINYKGAALDVVCIGKYDADNRLLITGSIIDYDVNIRDHIDVTSIYIPSTVRFIWDFAFDYCYTIESYTVSEENPVFSSVNGILFTKSQYTIVKYPLAKSLSSYTIPSGTVEIAYGAFGDGGDLFCPEYLNFLTIPKTVEVIGAINGGRGYRDARPADVDDIITSDGYEERLYNMFGFGLIIK